jgi:hypothetical protein
MQAVRLSFVLALSLACSSIPLCAQADPVEFYRSKVRPILVKNCYACHTQNSMSGLRLDDRSALLRGGRRGPAVTPGNPAASLLWQTLTHQHPLIKMPPQGQLNAEELAAIESWIEQGVHFDEPTASDSSRLPAKRPAANALWSLRPVSKPSVPVVGDGAWCRGNIDRFILAALEKKGLRPGPPAGKRTLLRRVTFDLIGLPPTPEEVDDYLRDESPAAFERVVDRLLASPRYGERWGRYWLDVVRYAEDDAEGLSATPRPNAFRYRDWVVEALNSDLRYDWFVRAQIAGDLYEHRPDLVGGVGMFGLGPRYNFVEPVKARSDEVQDLVDVLTRGFLGLTVACARCHDHKYDPITVRDYYGLAGVFYSVQPYEYPLAPKQVVDSYQAQLKHVTELEDAIKKLRADARTRKAEDLARGAGNYLLAIAELKRHGGSVKEVAAAFGLDARSLERMQDYIANPAKSHPYLETWDRIDWNASKETQVEKLAKEFQALLSSVIREQAEIQETNRRLLEEAKRAAGKDAYCVDCSTESKALPRDRFVLHEDFVGSKQRTDSKKSGVFFYEDETIDPFLDPEEQHKLADLKRQVKDARAKLPAQYPYLHVVRDVDQPRDIRIHLRGDPHNLGPETPRAFPAVLGGARFTAGSGRKELAEAIASDKNPLTARVAVNRVWHYHFGSGLVRSLSNFGLAGDAPSNPELLDYLASTFVENGWSVKKLHKEILLSATYALASEPVPANTKLDPENRLFWRASRRRLDVEAMRDAMALVGSTLDLTLGGPSVEWNACHRRSLYGKVSRYRTEKLLTLFDFPDPSNSSEQRAVTNTPLQWLFFLNSDFVAEQSQGLIRRVRQYPTDQDRVKAAYKIVYGRDPSDKEVAKALQFVSAGTGDAWNLLAQALLSSNEFLFVE